MANAFVHNRWILDTPGAALVTADNLYVKRTRWDGASLTPGTGQVIITDADDKVRWESRAIGATVAESDLIEQWWYGGFKLLTLEGGLLIIEVG